MPQRVYRFRDLKAAGVPFTRKHITAMEKKGKFPQHFNVTEFSVGWVAGEVDAWVESKIRSRAAVPEAAARNPSAPHRNTSAPVRSAGASDPRPGRRAAAQAAR